MSDVTNNEENVEVEVTDAVAGDAVAEETTAPVDAVATPPAPTTPSERKGPVITTPVAKEAAKPAAAQDDARVNPRKVREGIVVSNKMDMTLVVAVNERVSHPRYGKTVQRTKKLYVHDENNDAKVGDRVRVQETRPLSKLKRWRLTDVVERAR